MARIVLLVPRDQIGEHARRCGLLWIQTAQPSCRLTCGIASADDVMAVGLLLVAPSLVSTSAEPEDGARPVFAPSSEDWTHRETNRLRPPG